jgi:hypothetical protein
MSAEMDAAMIDPREFGRLEGEVKALSAQVEALQADVKKLLELANQSRGGLWVGMSIASALGAAGMWVIEHLLRR